MIRRVKRGLLKLGERKKDRGRWKRGGKDTGVTDIMLQQFHMLAMVLNRLGGGSSSGGDVELTVGK